MPLHYDLFDINKGDRVELFSPAKEGIFNEAPYFLKIVQL